MSKNQDLAKSDTYQGPGRVTASLGTGEVYAGGGLVAGAAISRIGGAIFRSSASRTALFYIGVTAFLVSPVIGLIKGWKASNRGKAQFETQREGLKEAGAMLVSQEQTIGQQKSQLASAHEELATERRRFTDTIKPRAEHGSHAEHAASHGDHASHTAEHASRLDEHGSHAGAHEADKAHAAHAGMAV